MADGMSREAKPAACSLQPADAYHGPLKFNVSIVGTIQKWQ
jgi:hypothetical protein